MAKKKLEEKCSFCGAKSDEVEKLIASPEAMICDECVLKSLEILIYGEQTNEIELDLENLDEGKTDEEIQSDVGC